MIEDTNYLKIEQYLAGTLPQDELVLFEKQMELNKDLADAVKLSVQVNLHMSNDFVENESLSSGYASEIRAFIESDTAKKIKEELEQAQKEFKLNEEFSVSRKKRFPFWAAASIVILLISSLVFFFSKSNSPEKLYAAYYSENDMPSVIQRDETNNMLDQGVIAYQNQDYLTAIDKFNATIDKSAALFIYKGMAYANTNQSSKSLSEFDQLINSDLLDASKGYWYKALVYLKDGDSENARATLKKIVENPSYFKYNQAKELLGKL